MFTDIERGKLHSQKILVFIFSNVKSHHQPQNRQFRQSVFFIHNIRLLRFLRSIPKPSSSPFILLVLPPSKDEKLFGIFGVSLTAPHLIASRARPGHFTVAKSARQQRGWSLQHLCKLGTVGNQTRIHFTTAKDEKDRSLVRSTVQTLHPLQKDGTTLLSVAKSVSSHHQSNN